MHELARMHLDVPRKRPEVPRQVMRVRVELDRDLARRIDLRVGRCVVPLDERVHAERLADLVVERHQREAEAEHRDGDDRQSRQRPAVFLRVRLVAHWFSIQYLAMMPKNVVSAIDTRIRAVFAFRLIWPTSATAGFPTCGAAPASAGASTRASRRLPILSPALFRRS